MLPNPIDTTYKLPSGPTSKSVTPPNPSPNTILLTPGEDGFSMTLDDSPLVEELDLSYLMSDQNDKSFHYAHLLTNISFSYAVPSLIEFKNFTAVGPAVFTQTKSGSL